MSGRKQHYIPQVLLRGFSTDPTTKHPPIWVYSKERGIYKTNTRDTAAEREFYSPLSDDPASLDNEITQYENALTEQLTALKSISVGLSADPTIAAETVVHLSIRNNHTRSSFESAATQILGATDALFSDPSWLKSELGLGENADPEKFRKLIQSAINEHFPLSNPGQLKAIETITRRNIDFEQFFAENLPQIQAILSMMSDRAPSMASNAHKKALTSSMVPERRVEALAALSWHIRKGDFFLPDCVAVAITRSGSTAPYFLTDIDDVTSVVFPLASDRALIGIGPDKLGEEAASPPSIAACCDEFFIASSRNKEFEELKPLIGTADNALKVGVQSAFDEARTKGLTDSSKSSLSAFKPNWT